MIPKRWTIIPRTTCLLLLLLHACRIVHGTVVQALHQQQQQQQQPNVQAEPTLELPPTLLPRENKQHESIKPQSEDQDQDQHPPEQGTANGEVLLIDWLRSKPGGFVSDKIGYVQTPLQDANHDRNGGLFALQDVAEGEILLKIPQSAMIGNYGADDDDEEDDKQDLCFTAYELINEYHKGNASAYAPYVQYIYHHQTQRSPVSDWSSQGKSLLTKLVGRELPLHKNLAALLEKEQEDNSFQEICGGSGDPMEEEAWRILKVQSWDDILLPVFDLANHRNGQWHNMDHHFVTMFEIVQDKTDDSGDDEEEEEGEEEAGEAKSSEKDDNPTAEGSDIENDEEVSEEEDSEEEEEEEEQVSVKKNMVEVMALRNIAKGEELYISYNACHEDDHDEDKYCETRAYKFVVPALFWQYGFVEPYPRRWDLQTPDGTKLVLELEETKKHDNNHKNNNNNNNDELELQVTWLSEQPDMMHLNWLRAHLKRLNNMKESISQEAQQLSVRHERKAILEYYDALTTALEQAIFWGVVEDEDDDNDPETVTEYEVSATGQLGTATDNRNSTFSRVYDTLEDRPDPLDYSTDICRYPLSTEGYEPIDQVRSQYQKVQFEHKEETGDTCLRLADWLQTCTSFRPHYHEAFVHYPARFLDHDVKRVIFFGGGDNMILHEILKYPSLELVIGMELDQQVVRSSFKNFGTQPHFDNPKVQWWFGDAAKSLRMLPQEYFGTFDLVLVDLLTYVTEGLMVTKDLSLMDVAVMLAKPDGVIARNEDFVRGRNVDFVKYTVDIEYHDVPILCQQSITMGSNQIDFLKKTPKNLDVDTVYLKTRGNGHFDGWYNYRTNEDLVNTDCHKEETEAVESADTTERRLGVLTILDLEEVNILVDSFETMKTRISKALQRAGVEEKYVVLSPTNSTSPGKNTMIFILQEGYVAVRAWPNHNYCAFDILLWSSQEKQSAVEAEVIAALAGNDGRSVSSSYRIVTGGMYGVAISKEDAAKVGPSSPELLCESTTGAIHEGSSTAGQSIIDDLLLDMLPLIRVSDPVVVVVCGEESSPCKSLEVLSKTNKVAKVLPVRACSALKDRTNSSSPSMYTCETEILRSLKESLAGEKISGLVLDQGAPHAVGRIMHKIFSSAINRKKLLEDHYAILAPSSYDTESSWRKTLLERFRTDFAQFSPAYRADVQFNGTTLELGIFSTGDVSFYKHLADMVETIERSTGLYSVIRDVKDGITNYIADFEPSKFVALSDYDLGPAREQWAAQTPLGQQTFFQFEIQAPLKALSVGENVLANLAEDVFLEKWYPCRVVEMFDDGTYNVLEIDDPSATTNVERGVIRKLETGTQASLLPIGPGERVLVKTSSTWRQGSVVERNSDETYEVHVYDESGRVTTVDPTNVMRKMEAPDTTELPELSAPKLKEVLQSAIDSLATEGDVPSITVHDDVGDGCLISSFWSEGSAVLQWDGRTHIDVNLVSFAEVWDERQNFQDAFSQGIPFLATLSSDQQPRGFGRVVNFRVEMEDR